MRRNFENIIQFLFMYDNNIGTQLPEEYEMPMSSLPHQFGSPFNGGGSGLIRGSLSAYGEKILGPSSEYVQSNICRYFSNLPYYFQVNNQYIGNKLMVVLLPFLHRGHWTRIAEPVGGKIAYRPPLYDINAPDLYVPCMAFGTYVVLAGISLGFQGKFSPEALNWMFVKGMLGWFLQASLLKVTLHTLSMGEAPVLDIVSYGGYTFAGVCVAVLGKLFVQFMYFILMPMACLCTGIFLVKTMKRVLLGEVRSYDPSKIHYVLPFIVLAQFPLFLWLGNISTNWIF